MPGLVGGMIVLNEEAMIGRNLAQHLDALDRLVIVEGADVHYPREHVTLDGLSTDRTAEIIRSFPDPQGKITFVQHGWAGDGREGHGKVVLREACLRLACADGFSGWFWHMDADEFVLVKDRPALAEAMLLADAQGLVAVRLPTVHFWKSLDRIVVGGYYDVDHIRFFRVDQSCEYVYRDEGSHNAPTQRGKRYHRSAFLKRSRELQVTPSGASHPGLAMYHMGFARAAEEVRAKTDYYRARGEVHSRPDTIRDREAWFAGHESAGLSVLEWCGCVPDCFRTEVVNGG